MLSTRSISVMAIHPKNFALLGLLGALFVLGTSKAEAQYGLTSPIEQTPRISKPNEPNRGSKINEIKLTNNTRLKVWYDFGSKEDQSLTPGKSITWRLGGPNQSMRKILFDRFVDKPGIQHVEYTLKSGKQYTFDLVRTRKGDEIMVHD